MTADLDGRAVADLDAGALLAAVDDLTARLAVVTAQRDAMLAAFGPRSDERDQHERARLDAWADGYRAGYAAGDETGSARTARLWHVTAAGLPMIAAGPSWAELDRKRYPCDAHRASGGTGPCCGRQSWRAPADEHDEREGGTR